VYPPGVPACRSCEAKEVAAVAKANAVTGSSHYVAEGDPVPDDLSPEVRLVGPGVPAAAAAEPEVMPDPGPGLTQPENSLVSSVLVEDYAGQTILALRDLCRQRGLPVAGAKADLVLRLRDDDARAVAV